jgi:putative heme transporter
MTRARAVRVAVLALVGLVALITLHERLPGPGQVMAAFGDAHPWYLVLAAVAELASMRHFALQQRRLLAGFGVGMSIPRAVAVTMSRSAIASSLPAGSAISAAYAFRQFRTAGATREAASGVTVLSGVLSAVALVLSYLAVLWLPADNMPTVLFVVAILAAAMLVFVADWRLSGKVYVPAAGATLEPSAAPGRSVLARLVVTARATVANLRELPPGSWSLSLLHAVVNWATDFACLAAVAAAFDLDVSVTRLATVYLSVQLVRQIPLTPGGTGIIEVALLAGLVSAGSPEGAAAATVLLYRLLSCWIIIPIGGLAFGVLRRHPLEAAQANTVPALAPMRVLVAGPRRSPPPRIRTRRRIAATPPRDRPPTRTQRPAYRAIAGRRPHG